MLGSIYQTEPRLAPGGEEVNKAVYQAAEFMSQYDQLEQARPATSQFAEKCFKGHITCFTERASKGYDDDAGMVEAIVLADEMVPELLPAAFSACVEQQEREALAQSIDQELQRVEREKALQQEAAAQEAAAPQPTRCNAEDVTRLSIEWLNCSITRQGKRNLLQMS